MTGNPELAVALEANVVPVAFAPGLANVIVWFSSTASREMVLAFVDTAKPSETLNEREDEPVTFEIRIFLASISAAVMTSPAVRSLHAPEDKSL